MKRTEIIPAIDIIGGKCVRLSQGDYNKKTVYGNPLDIARTFEDAGITRLHLVDLDGARANHVVNYKVLETIASKTRLIIDFGGGLKSDGDLQIAFENGAAMITGGSIAVKSPDLFLKWLSQYGPNRIILGADSKEGKISVSGWEETTNKPLLEFLEGYITKGIQKVIATDISKDGMLTGPAFELYREILDQFPGTELIASGGVSSMKDIEQLSTDGLSGVIVGKAIYEGQLSLKEINRYNLATL
jgi:phosphoribosylformimino-5-aminoimidazole carboxamide ribotide isomerase